MCSTPQNIKETFVQAGNTELQTRFWVYMVILGHLSVVFCYFEALALVGWVYREGFHHGGVCYACVPRGMVMATIISQKQGGFEPKQLPTMACLNF